jgi:hypothetical protein
LVFRRIWRNNDKKSVVLHLDHCSKSVESSAEKDSRKKLELRNWLSDYAQKADRNVDVR